jgi:uncharacterized protein YjbJ (UPF0337 family)
MNNDIFEGKWEKAKGKVRQQWGKLTDDDVAQVKGKAQALSGRLQERYGYSKDKAEKEIEQFSNSIH